MVNNLAVEAARTLVYDDPTHLEGVRILGVDEHKWKHVRGGGEDSYVTILVDLTPTIQGTGPARLLDVQAGRSAKVLTDWLAEHTQEFRDRIEVVTMDGFTGYHSATKEALPQATPVMDPFHTAGTGRGETHHLSPAPPSNRSTATEAARRTCSTAADAHC